MAENSDTKLYVALGVLALLGGGYYLQQQGSKKIDAEHSLEGESKALPELALTAEQTGKITKIVLSRPAKKAEGEEGTSTPAVTNVLVKTGDTWNVEEPVKALANQKNVESLLENLTKLAAKEVVSTNKDTFAQYEVDDAQAVHATFYEGDKVVREIWAGKSGGRGQMARVAGTEGVLILDGYSSFLYGRDTKGWRDLSILELDSEEVVSVTIKNENGEFTLEKDKEDWSGKCKGVKDPAAKKIDEFEPKKVADLLGAYKTLNASGFSEGKPLMELGLEKPLATLSFKLSSGKTVDVLFGETAEGSSRWAKLPDREQVYSVSSWASDWAFAKTEKFQKSDEPEEEPQGMPGGLPPGMMMPPGHP